MDLPEVVALITIIQNQMSINNINKLEDEIHLHKVSNIS